MLIELERATAEIGYWIAPAARRQGVAARAVELVSAWAFATLPLERIELMPYAGNDASAAVAAPRRLRLRAHPAGLQPRPAPRRAAVRPLAYVGSRSRAADHPHRAA